MPVGIADNYPPNEVFATFAFIGFVLCVIPFPWHFQAWNVGTCAYMFWVGLGCLKGFINALIWNHNAINWAPVWCDITSRMIIGENVAIAICSLAINRRLYFIATSDTVISSKADRQRAIRMDLLLCFGVPLLQMIIAIIPQGNRFQIYEDYGCGPSIYVTWLSLLLFNAWPVIIGTISAYYSVRTIIAFNKRRLQFNEVLSGHSKLTQSRYIRLMVMAATNVVCVVPLAIVILWANSTTINPWVSWDVTHSDFMRVDLYPAIIWHNSGVSGAALESQRWFNVLSAFLFFGLFGVAEDSRRNYMSALNSAATKVGVSTTLFSGSGTSNTMTSSFGSSNGKTLPVFVHRQTRRKHDSLESFTDMSMSQTSEVKERSFRGTSSFGAFSFHEGDYTKEKDLAPESPSTDTSSTLHQSMPHPSEAIDLNIEISSVRRLSAAEPLSGAPRHSPDVPTAAEAYAV